MPLVLDLEHPVIDSSIEEAARRDDTATTPRATGARAILIACLALAPLGGCSERRRDPGGSDSSSVSLSEPGEAGTPPLRSSGLTAPTVSAVAAPKASADADASLAGTWEGTYDAKKGSVEMPAKVKDARRAADDGKATAGAGTVSITISQNGEISGKATGALGDATLRGKAESGVIRASVFSDNPGAPTSMTGWLVGTVKESSIQAQMRVSGPDATVVREATFELKRK